MSTTLTILDAAEVALRDECLTTIRAHRDGFIAAGEALEKMRDSRLYRDTYATFGDFCKAELGQGKAYAYRLIDAARVVSPLGDKSAITSERQARELSRVPAPERGAVVERASQATGGKITAAAICEAAKPEPVDVEIVETSEESPHRKWWSENYSKRKPAPPPPRTEEELVEYMAQLFLYSVFRYDGRRGQLPHPDDISRIPRLLARAWKEAVNINSEETSQ